MGEIWTMAVGSIGDIIFSGSNDKSLRVWTQTKEQIFAHEEREKR